MAARPPAPPVAPTDSYTDGIRPQDDPHPGDHENAGRTPPHNTAAERALIGAWLISTDARTHHVPVADFYHPTAARISTAIHELAAAGQPIDQLTVADHLERHGQLDAIGGPATLASLIADMPMTTSAGRYAQIIRRDAHHRRLLWACHDLSEAIYALDDPAIEAAQWRLLEVIAEQESP